MFGAHTLATTVSCLDFKGFLFASHLNLLILHLDALELHNFHINYHGSAIYTPQVKRLLYLAAIKLDQSLLKLAISLGFLCDC